MVVLTLTPFFKIGFTTSDDVEYYLSVLENNVFRDAKMYAEHSGRFYFLITKPLYHVPYLIDNFYFTKIIQYSFLLLSFTLFTIVIKKIFKEKEFALLSFLLLFAFLTVTSNYHIPIIAYPFYFTLSFSILLLSILRLIKYFERNKNQYLVQAVILFAIALLFYETYLIFLFLLCVFILIRNIVKHKSSLFKSKGFYKEIIPFVGIAILYLIVYFGYRQMLATDGKEFYHGSSFSNEISLNNVFKILVNYNNIAIPRFAYNIHQPIIETNSILATGHQKGFLYMLTNADIYIVVNTIIQCFVFVLLFIRIKNNISWKKVGLGSLIAVIVMFSVHLLLALSAKYNSPYWLGGNGYVTTFYSYFMLILVTLLFMYSIVKLSFRINWLKNIFIGVFTLLIFYLSIVIGYSNYYISRDWQRSQRQFQVMDELCKRGAFDKVPENSIVYASDLYKTSTTGNDLYTQSFSWSIYVYDKIGKKIEFCEDQEAFINKVNHSPNKEIFYMSKYEAPKYSDALYVLTNVDKNSIDFYNQDDMFNSAKADFADAYFYSAYKEFFFEFFIPESENIPIIIVNNSEEKIGNAGYNLIKVSNVDKKDAITTVNIQSSEPLSVNKFLLSTIATIDEE
jgi:hypothetical protein